MQGKRYAVFSRFSVHTARVTYLIKNLYFLSRIRYTLYKRNTQKLI